MSLIAVILTVSGYISRAVLVSGLFGGAPTTRGFFTGNRRTRWYQCRFGHDRRRHVGASVQSPCHRSVAADFVFLHADGRRLHRRAADRRVRALVPLSLLRWLKVVFALTSTFRRAVRHRLPTAPGPVSSSSPKMLGRRPAGLRRLRVMQLLVFGAFTVGRSGPTPSRHSVVRSCGSTRSGAASSRVYLDRYGSRPFVLSAVWSSPSFSSPGLWASAARSFYPRGLRIAMSQIFFFDNPLPTVISGKCSSAASSSFVAMIRLDPGMMQCNLSCRTPRDAPAQYPCLLRLSVSIIVILLFLVLGVLSYFYMSTAAPFGALPAKATIALFVGRRRRRGFPPSWHRLRPRG